jgi:bifunctional DNase/RNase
VSLKRPLTHDLLANVIAFLGGELESVTIADLADHTFFASLDIRTEKGELINVDARPSDAIAVAAGQDVPILVAEHVLEDASPVVPPSTDPDQSPDPSEDD